MEQLIKNGPYQAAMYNWTKPLEPAIVTSRLVNKDLLYAQN